MKQQASRTGRLGIAQVRVTRASLPCTLFVCAVMLVGCTASWRAPVESRGHRAPAPKVSPAPQALPSPVARGTYRVRPGDTLYGIAWQQGIDYRLIAAWNRIPPPYHIFAGQTLRLSAPPQSHTASAVRKPTTGRPPVPRQPTPDKQPPSAPQRLAWHWPVRGAVVARFKPSDPLRSGIKIRGREGDPVRAAEGGRIVYSGSGLIGYGRLIIVKHNDNYLSAYGHNRKILVNEGDRVTKGQKIAEMGVTNAGQPLLHFEIRRDGKPVDPVGLLPRG